MGAVGSGGVRVLSPDVPGLMGVSAQDVEDVTARELAELSRREQAYRAGRAPLDLHGRDAILVDDGIATGASMRVAVAVARSGHPARLAVAAPVAAPATLAALQQADSGVDDVVCLAAPARFRAVSQWYRTFDQTTDREVQELLAQAWAGSAAQGADHQH